MGLHIDFAALGQAFENHAPDLVSFLDLNSGLVHVAKLGTESAEVMTRDTGRFLMIEPIASRDQYQMMESFIETVISEPLKLALSDAIVGRGAFRRFKDTVGKFADERKRWFAFRDVLLHRYVTEWMDRHAIVGDNTPVWPESLPLPAAQNAAIDVDALASTEVSDVAAYLKSWARSHGDEHRYLFGPAAFERLAEDLCREFEVQRRKLPIPDDSDVGGEPHDAGDVVVSPEMLASVASALG